MNDGTIISLFVTFIQLAFCFGFNVFLTSESSFGLEMHI